MKKNTLFFQFFCAVGLLCTMASCEKVSPIGVLVSGTGVEDRVKMSNLYYSDFMGDAIDALADGDYTFLVGADSHITDDLGRMTEMLQIGLDNDDDFYVHLGDIADTKAEYYINLGNLLNDYKQKYVDKYYTKDTTNAGQIGRVYYDNEALKPYDYDDIRYPFFPIVGNHDLTHNGWPLWCNLFHSSFYEFNVYIDKTDTYDHFIFLDTASGTLGAEQVNLIEQGVLDAEVLNLKCRNTFVFSHTNIFRPSSLQFSSTFAKEETYFLLNQFDKWNVTTVFCGHVHAWDERDFSGVHYISLDSMSERNSPEAGDYLVRVHVKADGTIKYERVHMSYVKKN